MKKIFILLLVFLVLPVVVFAASGVEINTASLQQLDEITGVGPALAQRIVDARPFSSVDDLLKVKGIGEKTLQKIKDQGMAYVAEQGQQPAQEVAPMPTPVAPSVPTLTPTPAPAPTPAIIYPDGVFINEVMPSPAGPDETDEWIELYNSNNVDVDLQGWKIQDTQGTTTDYAFPKDAKIAALGYLILKRPSTKILLNNEGDGLNLISPDGKAADSVLFEKAPKNQSYAKTASGWAWNSNLTPGAVNAIITKAVKALPSPQKTDNTNTYVAAVAEPLLGNTDETKTSNPWFLFLIAIAITIISAVVILILKFKLFKILNRKS